MPTTHSPLRYPGGKSQLAPFVIELLKVNKLQKGVYAEPFAGGAGIAWELLLSGHVSEVWINDLDPAIFSFWKSVLSHTDELCRLIEATPVTIDEWQRQKAVLADTKSGIVELGFATLFLNRTNRSGILKAGAIGGLNQNGNYKLDCRFKVPDLVHKIRRIAKYQNVVKLSMLDAAECLKLWDKKLPERSLINIDPPYFEQGRALYLNYYKPKDHEDLASVVRNLERPWMVTYDDEPFISNLYAGLPRYRNSLVYFAQVKRRAEELMFLAPRLSPPNPLQKKAA